MCAASPHPNQLLRHPPPPTPLRGMRVCLVRGSLSYSWSLVPSMCAVRRLCVFEIETIIVLFRLHPKSWSSWFRFSEVGLRTGRRKSVLLVSQPTTAFYAQILSGRGCRPDPRLGEVRNGVLAQPTTRRLSQCRQHAGPAPHHPTSKLQIRLRRLQLRVRQRTSQVRIWAHLPSSTRLACGGPGSSPDRPPYSPLVCSGRRVWH